MATKEKKYFYGNEISEYGLENGFVDYRTLAKAFDAVLNNEIMEKTAEIGYWEQESGWVDNSEEIEELEEKIEEAENDIADIEEQIEEAEENIEAYKEELEDCPELSFSITGEEANIDIFKDRIEELERQIEKWKSERDDLEEEQEPEEVFQWYIVDDSGARLLKECNEIVYYNEDLDMYLWGVTHWGTAWDYVLTNIKIDW